MKKVTDKPVHEITFRDTKGSIGINDNSYPDFPAFYYFSFTHRTLKGNWRRAHSFDTEDLFELSYVIFRIWVWLLLHPIAIPREPQS